MKKINIIALILVCALAAFARPAKRIRFQKGALKVTVTGKFKGYKDSQVYLIRLRAGQTMKIDADKPVSLFITDPKGEDASDMDLSCHSHQIVEKSLPGDYKIKAVECQKADPWNGTYRLTLRVK